MLWVLDVLKIMIVLPYILVLLPGTSFKDSNEHIPGDVYLGATGHLVTIRKILESFLNFEA